MSTWLGRTSPAPPAFWREAQAAAQHPEASPAAGRRAHSAAREWGRFTRNFVVQGTAAEWSLIWLAEIRHRLAQLPEVFGAAEASGPFAREPHLAAVGVTGDREVDVRRRLQAQHDVGPVTLHGSQQSLVGAQAGRNAMPGRREGGIKQGQALRMVIHQHHA